MRLSLLAIATLLAGTCYEACARDGGLALYPDNNTFPFGVGSGDPGPSSVYLWTMLNLPDDAPEQTLRWAVRNVDSTKEIQNGTIVVSGQTGGAATVLVDNLSPRTRYSYQFALESDTSKVSEVGRTKTAPTINDDADVKFGSLSCSSMWSGYLNGYRHMVDEQTDIDAILHLGDYIYPDINPVECIRFPKGLCDHPWWNRCRYSDDPQEVEDPFVKALIDDLDCERLNNDNLYAYRFVHKYHLMDPNLRYARRSYPFIILFDNHDSGDLAGVLDGALQAYTEFIPGKFKFEIESGQIKLEAYRHLAYGQNLDIIVVDTIASGDGNTFLGANQTSFIRDTLSTSKQRNATWRMFASPVQFMPLSLNNSYRVTEIGFVLSFLLTVFAATACLGWYCHTVRKPDEHELLHVVTVSTSLDAEKPGPEFSDVQVETNHAKPSNLVKFCVGCGVLFVVLVISMWIAAAVLLSRFDGEELKYLAPKSRTWDGNPVDRQNLMQDVIDSEVGKNNVWITGDMHLGIAAHVYQHDASMKSTLLEPKDDVKVLGVEVLSYSLSRGNLDERAEQEFGISASSSLAHTLSVVVEDIVRRANPQYAFFDGINHGYSVLTYSASQVHVSFWTVPIDKITEEGAKEMQMRVKSHTAEWETLE